MDTLNLPFEKNISVKRITDDMKFMTSLGGRAVFSKGCQDAKKYIEQNLKSAGWHVKEFPFSLNGLKAENIIANMTENKGNILILTAHYDSTHLSPGANDNASGVTVLLEIARVLAEVDPNTPVRLVFLNGEEQGWVGSSAYAEYLQAKQEDIKGILNFEMVGHSPKKPTLYVRYRKRAKEFALHIGEVGSQMAVPVLPIRDVGCGSDDYAFERAGYPAVMIIGDYPHCSIRHGDEDRLDRLNMSLIAEAVRLGLLTSLSS